MQCTSYIEQTITEKIQAQNPLNNSTEPIPSQKTITFPHLTHAEKSKLNSQAAMWCFMDNLPFHAFENQFAKTFIHSLNPAYVPPSRKQLAGSLLDSTYISTKEQVDSLIAAMPNINVVTDESSNISASQIYNRAIHTRKVD